MTLVRTGLRVLAGLAALSAVGLGLIYWYDRTGQRPDPAFDTAVTTPAYQSNGPRVAFDVGHRNWHTPTDRYRPFAQLLRHDGYDVRQCDSLFTPSALDSVRVLIVPNAMGPEDHEGRAAFTEAEDSVLVHSAPRLFFVWTIILTIGSRAKVRHSAAGHAQGIAMPFGQGRVVVLGEAGLLSAQVDALGNTMGMNHPGNDDRQFALNILHWRSRAA